MQKKHNSIVSVIQKHCENRKTRKQICYSIDSSDSSEKVHAPSPQFFFATSLFFTFSELLTHLTTDVMFSGQRFVILAMFFVERLGVFFVWIVCMIFFDEIA